MNPFVGRTGELAVLRSLVSEARSGRPRTVLLTGQAGIGGPLRWQILGSMPGRTQVLVRHPHGHG